MSSTSTTSNILIPSENALKAAAKLSIETDKPICLDYYGPSFIKGVGSAVIGRNAENQKFLVKSAEEYTTQCKRLYEVAKTEYLFETENSVYIVSSTIELKNVKMS